MLTVTMSPSSDPAKAFNSFAAAQSAPRAGAALANQLVPPHVIIPCVRKWTYLYVIETDLTRLLYTLAHTKCVFADLQLNELDLLQVTKSLSIDASRMGSSQVPF